MKIYFGLGFAWWLYQQFTYVTKVKPYWQGVLPSDPNTALGTFTVSAQTVALWPVSVFETIHMQIPGS